MQPRVKKEEPAWPVKGEITKVEPMAVKKEEPAWLGKLEPGVVKQDEPMAVKKEEPGTPVYTHVVAGQQSAPTTPIYAPSLLAPLQPPMAAGMFAQLLAAPAPAAAAAAAAPASMPAPGVAPDLLAQLLAAFAPGLLAGPCGAPAIPPAVGPVMPAPAAAALQALAPAAVLQAPALAPATAMGSAAAMHFTMPGDLHFHIHNGALTFMHKGNPYMAAEGVAVPTAGVMSHFMTGVRPPHPSGAVGPSSSRSRKAGERLDALPDTVLEVIGRQLMTSLLATPPNQLTTGKKRKRQAPQTETDVKRAAARSAASLACAGSRACLVMAQAAWEVLDPGCRDADAAIPKLQAAAAEVQAAEAHQARWEGADHLKLADLKAACRAAGCTVSGSKGELVARLQSRARVRMDAATAGMAAARKQLEALARPLLCPVRAQVRQQLEPVVAAQVEVQVPQPNRKICKTSAMKTYGLNEKDLQGLTCTQKPNPHAASYAPMRLYRKGDLVGVAMRKHGFSTYQQLEDLVARRTGGTGSMWGQPQLVVLHVAQLQHEPEGYSSTDLDEEDYP